MSRPSRFLLWLHRSIPLFQLKDFGEFSVWGFGEHIALDASLAILAALHELDVEEIRANLKKFIGIKKRFDILQKDSKFALIDDYGHHPTEVRATLQAFREKFPTQRLVVYFQPHRYSRTQHCWQDFKSCFLQSDVLFMADIYPAGETAIPGITSEKLLEEMKHENSFHTVKSGQQIKVISESLKSGDVFITLGAGDGWKLGLDVLSYISKR